MTATATALPVVNVILRGPIDPGADLGQIAHDLARLFRIELAQAQQVLARAPTTVKRNLPHDKAPAYIDALRRIGLAAHADAVATEPAATPEPQPVPSAEPAVPPALLLEPVEETMDCPACSHRQPKRTLCQRCGANMPAMLAAAASAEVEARQPLGTLRDQATPSAIGSADPYAFDPFTPSPWSFSLTGRLGRLRSLQYNVLLYVPLLVFGLITVTLGNPLTLGAGLLIPLLGIALWAFYQSFRLMALRLHDLGRPTSYAAGIIVAMVILAAGSKVSLIIGLLSLLFWLGVAGVLLFAPGDTDDNEYGPPADPVNVIALAGSVVGVMILSGLVSAKLTSALTSAVMNRPSASAEALVERANRTLPETRFGIRMERVLLEPGPVVVFPMTFTQHTSDDVDAVELRSSLLAKLQEDSCNNPQFADALEDGLRIGYRVYGNDGRQITALQFDQRDCE
ncbi:DUF805 domain-containing protein [Chitinibacteraceae bacterium HSL-7]